MSLSRLRSSLWASCLSRFVGVLLKSDDAVRAEGLELAAVKLGLRYDLTRDMVDKLFPPIGRGPGRTTEGCETDSYGSSSSKGFLESSSVSSSRSLAIDSSARDRVDEWLRPNQGRVAPSVDEDMIIGGWEVTLRRPRAHRRNSPPVTEWIVHFGGAEMSAEAGGRVHDLSEHYLMSAIFN